MERHYLECACSSNEHTLRFTTDNDDPEIPTIYISTFLGDHSFLHRVWNSIKYIFGYKCRYGHFEETILEGDQVKELKEVCDNLLNTCYKTK